MRSDRADSLVFWFPLGTTFGIRAFYIENFFQVPSIGVHDPDGSPSLAPFNHQVDTCETDFLAIWRPTNANLHISQIVCTFCAQLVLACLGNLSGIAAIDVHDPDS